MGRMRNVAEAYRRFVSGFGFSLVIVVCIGVITATAVWTKKREQPYIPPTVTPRDEMSAAAVLQENLEAAATPTPVRTAAIVWTKPLERLRVVRAYSPDALVSSGFGGLWQTHDGVDLHAEAGEAVVSISKGIVQECGSDPLSGAWAVIDFGQGWTARYSGLSVLAAIKENDRVSAGQTIGFAGNMSITDAAGEPCVHLSVYHDGNSVDPIVLFDE